MTRPVLMIAALALVFAAGCKPKAREITSVQRREAGSLASEAKFALSVRDVTRAETALARATELCPDAGDYWLELGRCRVKLGQRGLAKTAYQSALDAFAEEAKHPVAGQRSPALREVYVLALLGRVDEARVLLITAQKDFPDNREVRAFVESHQFDQMLATPAFKEAAL